MHVVCFNKLNKTIEIQHIGFSPCWNHFCGYGLWNIHILQLGSLSSPPKIANHRGQRVSKWGSLTPEPRKKPSYFPWNWLVYRDPYIGLWNNPYITGQYNHLYNPTNQGFEHCSPGNLETSHLRSRSQIPRGKRLDHVGPYHRCPGWIGDGKPPTFNDGNPYNGAL